MDQNGHYQYFLMSNNGLNDELKLAIEGNVVLILGQREYTGFMCLDLMINLIYMLIILIYR